LLSAECEPGAPPVTARATSPEAAASGAASLSSLQQEPPVPSLARESEHPP
jgi:hypothetical protein